MAEDDLAARLHRNLMAVASSVGGERDERDGELLYASDSPLPFMNFAARAGPHGDAAAFLERARAFFAGRHRGFVVFTWPGDPELGRAADADGMAEVLRRYPEMACPAPVAELPGDVRRVETEEQGAAYWRICDAAYPSIGMPENFFTPTFPAAAMLPGPAREACLGYHEGEPVACASVFLAEGVGMICWVGALPEARGRGLAAACTAWATNRGFALGADVAALQASDMGEPIYRRMGYEEAYAYRLFGVMAG
jgi:ribosomal protein S18 acetylase RimI-like enzyme